MVKAHLFTAHLFTSILKRAANTLQARCRLCEAACDGILCAPCDELVFAQALRCPQCARHSPQGLRCGACLRDAPAFDSTFTLGDYSALARPLIAQLKFHQEPGLARHLGERLALLLQAQGFSPSTLVMPVPLSTERLRERGYNQAWELARVVAATLGLSADHTSLRRVTHSAAQAGLSLEQREKNLRGAFVCTAQLGNRPVLLIDDVMTSGTTLNEATRALKKAQAGVVTAAIVLRTQS
jgi:ComF family protein